MAANCVRQTLRVSSSFAKTLLSSSSSSSSFASKAASKLTGLAASKPNSASRFSLPKLNSSRLPVELASLQSLMPLHSVTASALFTSMLSLHDNKICDTTVTCPVSFCSKLSHEYLQQLNFVLFNDSDST